jgi:hypothetical protein
VLVEWRDSKLVMISPVYADPIPLNPAGDPDTFIVGLGFRDSGETVRFGRAPDGRVASVRVGSDPILRLGPVDGGADT